MQDEPSDLNLQDPVRVIRKKNIPVNATQTYVVQSIVV